MRLNFVNWNASKVAQRGQNHQGRLVTTYLTAALLMSGLLLTTVSGSARAAGLVSVCSFGGPGGLAAALAGGGTVSFGLDCAVTFPGRYTISANTTIDAAGHAVTLSGASVTGLFYVKPGVQLTLMKVNLDSGMDSAGGGAIYNQGTVMIQGGSVTNNKAPGGYGGAIYNDGGSVTIWGGWLAYNNAGYGGAIFSNSKVAIQSSRLDKNTAYYGGAIFSKGGDTSLNYSTLYANNVGSNGGAVYTSYGALYVQNSTFDTNWSSNGNGGAIYHEGTLSGLVAPQLNNSIFVNNRAGNWGGAVYLQDTTAQLANATLTANTASAGGALYTYKARLNTINATLSANSALSSAGGSNIYNNGMTSWVVFTNSILHKPGGVGNNCDGAPVTNGGSNIEWPGSTAGCGWMWGVNPVLGGLAANGGPTQTMALGAGSPALDTANNAVCAAAPINNLDQRGYVRPTDGDGDGFAKCDIGAYER